MEADAHFGAMLNVSFGVPSKGALPQGISRHKDPVGEPEGGLFAWIFFKEKRKSTSGFCFWTQRTLRF